MALFLNTQKISHWLNEIISGAEKELILIVPYIKTSNNIFESLQDADDRGVEIILIYRENKLNEKEKIKLFSLKNITILHHPNIHCKCYYNGELLILCSMNLYEYSELNNREMGTLFTKERIYYEKEILVDSDFATIFLDAVEEIKEIINGSTIEKLNDDKKDSPFEIEIAKNEEELTFEKCEELNSFFLNKRFKPVQIKGHYWLPLCKNYFDNIDVTFEGNRFGIEINLPEEDLEIIFNKWKKNYNEYEFKGFKYYWNYHKSFIYVYKDKRFDWDVLEKNDKLRMKKFKQGIDLVIKKYRTISGK
jgi:hypothetical protein